jgi:hypothetical protein
VSTCTHCQAEIVWLTTTTGRRPFNVATEPYDAVPDGEGYLIRAGIAVPTTDAPPRALRGNPRVAVRHRCQQYRDWRLKQVYGLGAGIDTVKNVLTEGSS